MRSRMCLVSGLVLVPLLASELPAQWRVIVGPQRQVNPQGQRWQECSVGALVGDANHLMVSAQRAGFGAIHYGVSVDAGESFTTHTFEDGSGDSGVVVDPASDTLWLSMLGAVGESPNPGHISVAWKLPSQTEIPQDQVYVAYETEDPQVFTDKPLMAIGADGWHHLLYVEMGDGPHALWTAHSNDPTDPTYPPWDTVRVEP